MPPLGFTISLFIGGLAFCNPVLVNGIDVGMLCGSVTSALAGYALLRFVPPTDVIHL